MELFYKIFWDNKSCQNLFLLSKIELLDSKTFTLFDKPILLPFPRIILSNQEIKKIDKYQIDIRNERSNLTTEQRIQSHVNELTPLIEKFFKDVLERPIEKFRSIFEDPSEKVEHFVIGLIEAENKELYILNALKEFGLVKKHINNIDELREYLKKEILLKKIDKVISTQSYWSIIDCIRGIKEFYNNENQHLL